MRAASDLGGNRSASARQHRASGATSQPRQAHTHTPLVSELIAAALCAGGPRSTLSRPAGTLSFTAISTTAMEHPTPGPTDGETDAFELALWRSQGAKLALAGLRSV